jgi:hypothetical protein
VRRGGVEGEDGVLVESLERLLGTAGGALGDGEVREWMASSILCGIEDIRGVNAGAEEGGEG